MAVVVHNRNWLLKSRRRGAMAGKAPKAWALPRFWVSIHFYKKQPVKKIGGRILGLAWLKFAMEPLYHGAPEQHALKPRFFL